MIEWRLSEARSKFSEVLDRVSSEGPQQIRRRNERFVVITLDQYRELRGEKPTFKDWLMSLPDLSELNLERDRTPMREISW